MVNPTCQTYLYINSLTPLFEREARTVFERFSRQIYTEDSRQYIISYVDSLPLTEVAQSLQHINYCDQHGQAPCQYHVTLEDFRTHLKQLAAYSYVWCFRDSDRTTFSGLKIGVKWQSYTSRIDDCTLMCNHLYDPNHKRDEIRKNMGGLYRDCQSKLSSIDVEQPLSPSCKRECPLIYCFKLTPEIIGGYYHSQFITKLRHESYEYQVECKQDCLHKAMVLQLLWLPPCRPLPHGGIRLRATIEYTFPK